MIISKIYNLGSDYNFNDEAVKGILESKPANLGLGWETVALTDFGVDIDLFDNKFKHCCRLLY